MEQREGQPTFKNQDNALIWAELEHIRKSVENIDKNVTLVNGRVRQSELNHAVLQERWKTHFEEHKSIRRNGFLSDLISSIVAAVVAVATILGLR